MDAMCDRCRGACCESFHIPAGKDDDTGRWLSLHGRQAGRFIEFECRCSKLSADGLCSIYEDRPKVCVEYEAGGTNCLITLQRRRTPEQIRNILRDR